MDLYTFLTTVRDAFLAVFGPEVFSGRYSASDLYSMWAQEVYVGRRSSLIFPSSSVSLQQALFMLAGKYGKTDSWQAWSILVSPPSSTVAAQAAPVTTDLTTVVTGGDGPLTPISAVMVTNTSGSTIQASVTLAPAGADHVDEHTIAAVDVPAHDQVPITVGSQLGDTDELRVQTSTANIAAFTVLSAPTLGVVSGQVAPVDTDPVPAYVAPADGPPKSVSTALVANLSDADVTATVSVARGGGDPIPLKSQVVPAGQQGVIELGLQIQPADAVHAAISSGGDAAVSIVNAVVCSASDKKVCGQAVPSGTGLTALYTVPAEGPAVPFSASVVNMSDSDLDATIVAVPPGASDSDPSRIVSFVTVPANSTLPVAVGRLQPGTVVRCKTSSAGNAAFTALIDPTPIAPVTTIQPVAQVAPPTTAMTPAFTAPADGPPVTISAVSIANTSASPITASVAVSPLGAVFDPVQVIAAAVPIPAKSAVDFPMGIVIAPADVVRVQTSTPDVAAFTIQQTQPSDDMVSIVYDDGSSYYGPSGSSYDAGAVAAPVDQTVAAAVVASPGPDLATPQTQETVDLVSGGVDQVSRQYGISTYYTDPYGGYGSYYGYNPYQGGGYSGGVNYGYGGVSQYYSDPYSSGYGGYYGGGYSYGGYGGGVNYGYGGVSQYPVDPYGGYGGYYSDPYGGYGGYGSYYGNNPYGGYYGY